MRLLTLGLCLWSSIVSAQNLGTHGMTYRIAEPDFTEGIKSRVKAKMDSGEFDRLRDEAKSRVKEHFLSPPPVQGLTPATEYREFFFDPTITVTEDVMTPSGAVIVPAGTSINPLDYVPFTQRWIFIDGREPAQLDWARKQLSADDGIKPIFIAGEWVSQWKKWQHRTYFDQGGALVRKFGIVATPAVVSQSSDGRSIRIEEIVVANP